MSNRQKRSANLRSQRTHILGSTQIFDITKYVRAKSPLLALRNVVVDRLPDDNILVPKHVDLGS